MNRPSSWSVLARLLEAPAPRKKSPPTEAADSMQGSEKSRLMIWRVLDEGGPRSTEFFRRLRHLGWTRAKIGIYDLLWNTEEWRPASAPQGSGVGRSMEAIFSLFEPMSNESRKLYGWRDRKDTDRPSDDFLAWAKDSLPALRSFANALPEYADVRLEPVSIWGSRPGDAARTKAGPSKHGSLPVIWFDRDGKFWLFMEESTRPTGEPVPGTSAKMSGKISVDPGHLSAGDDDVDTDDDWIGAGSRPRMRGPHRALSRVGGKVKGDGSMSRMLAALAHDGKQKVVLGSASTSEGERNSPHAKLRDVPDLETMASLFGTNQVPLPPGIWDVADLRRTLRMVARATGTEL